MPKTLSGIALPQEEIENILRIAEQKQVDPRLLAAIRKAENGKPGREFGCFAGAYPPTFDGQAECAADTVKANLRRFELFGHEEAAFVDDRVSSAFLEFLGTRYAPIGAPNDPNNLNVNWIPNVKRYYAQAELIDEA